MDGVDGKSHTVLKEIDNHYLNLGIGWIHPALLLNLLTYREKALSTLKELIQGSRGEKQKLRFYMGMFKFLRDTIKNPIPEEIKALRDEGVNHNTINSLTIYLNVIRINVRKIISFGKWFKTLDEPERLLILKLLLSNCENLLFSKMVEELVFLEFPEIIENILSVARKSPCSPYLLVIFREYLGSGFYTKFHEEISKIISSYSDCSIPRYISYNGDLSRFSAFATIPTLSGSQTFMVARRENSGIVDTFNFTLHPALGITSFAVQENIPYQLFRDFEEYGKTEMVKVSPEFVVRILKGTLFNMRLLSLEIPAEFAFYRRFMGEDALLPEELKIEIPGKFHLKNGNIKKSVKNPSVQKWIYNSVLVKRLLEDPDIKSLDKLTDELFDHRGVIKEGLKRLLLWAMETDEDDIPHIFYLYNKADDKKFVEIFAREIWNNRMSFYMATP